MLSSGVLLTPGLGSGTEQGLCFQEHCPRSWRSLPRDGVSDQLATGGRGPQGIWCGSREWPQTCPQMTLPTGHFTREWPGCPCSLCGHLRCPRWGTQVFRAGNLPPIHRWWGAGGSADTQRPQDLQPGEPGATLLWCSVKAPTESPEGGALLTHSKDVDTQTLEHVASSVGIILGLAICPPES